MQFTVGILLYTVYKRTISVFETIIFQIFVFFMTNYLIQMQPSHLIPLYHLKSVICSKIFLMISHQQTIMWHLSLMTDFIAS